MVCTCVLILGCFLVGRLAVASRRLTPGSEQQAERCGAFPRVSCGRWVAIRQNRPPRCRAALLPGQVRPGGFHKDPACPRRPGRARSRAQERRARSIILKYSLARTLQRASSGEGGLGRPICLADHCLCDAAANVTFLFQSKTQQGVPSVWHRPARASPMPFCADHFTWQFAKNLSFLALAKYNDPKWAVFSEYQQRSQMEAVFLNSQYQIKWSIFQPFFFFFLMNQYLSVTSLFT